MLFGKFTLPKTCQRNNLKLGEEVEINHFSSASSFHIIHILLYGSENYGNSRLQSRVCLLYSFN